jgi:eukaryotic translation initiation factor 2C
MTGVSLKGNFPQRPAYGTRGKQIVLWTNHFELISAEGLALYRYHVSLSPEAKGRKLKRVFQLLIQDSALAGSVTDFKSILVSRKKFEDMEIEVAYRTEIEDDPQPDSRPYRIHIQATGQMEVAALLDHIKSTQADLSFRPEKQLQIIQALNIVLGYYPQSNQTMTTIAGNKHFSFGINSEACDLGGGLSALRGFFRSVRLGTARILVNINVSHAVFFKPGPLVDLINIFANAYGRNAWQLEKFLKKVRVETTHLPVKKNKAGERIPRIKTIIALANTGDGQSLIHPPQITKFAAGPKEVKFWLDTTSQTALAKPRANQAKSSAKPFVGYITVYDFFRKCR